MSVLSLYFFFAFELISVIHHPNDLYLSIKRIAIMELIVLRSSIIAQFKEVWELNDLAHRENHFEEVFQCGMVINDTLGKRYDPKLIMLAAYFHDMFAWSRHNHHEMSHRWVNTTDNQLFVNLNSHDRWMVASGCLQHRASYKGLFNHEFSELINAADRGFPGEVDLMLQRAIQYRTKWYPEMEFGDRITESIKHIKEKFGKEGYARYPELYERAFKGKLDLQREAIEAL